MKKLAAVFLSTLIASPAFALGNHSLARTGGLAAARTAATASLPAISNTVSFSGRGFGKGASIEKPTTLPGLGTVNTVYSNTGKGGTSSLKVSFVSNAAASQTLPGLSTVSPTATSYTADTSISKAGVNSARKLNYAGRNGATGTREVALDGAQGIGITRSVNGSATPAASLAGLGTVTRSSSGSFVKGQGGSGEVTITAMDSTGAGKTFNSKVAYNPTDGYSRTVTVKPVVPVVKDPGTGDSGSGSTGDAGSGSSGDTSGSTGSSGDTSGSGSTSGSGTDTAANPGDVNEFTGG